MANANETKIQEVARKLCRYRFMMALLEDKVEEMEANFKTLLSTQTFKGMALVPGSPRCNPKWKEEGQELAKKLGLDPDVWIAQVQAKTGKKPTESKLSFDEELQPNEEAKEHLAELIERI